MSGTLERIRREASELPYEELEALIRVLELDLNSFAVAEDPSEIEVAWEHELATRVRDVEEGKVDLISGQESEDRMASFFKKHGISR